MILNLIDTITAKIKYTQYTLPLYREEPDRFESPVCIVGAKLEGSSSVLNKAVAQFSKEDFPWLLPKFRQSEVARS